MVSYDFGIQTSERQYASHMMLDCISSVARRERDSVDNEQMFDHG